LFGRTFLQADGPERRFSRAFCFAAGVACKLYDEASRLMMNAKPRRRLWFSRPDCVHPDKMSRNQLGWGCGAKNKNSVAFLEPEADAGGGGEVVAGNIASSSE
jgi:hypothetical protein